MERGEKCSTFADAFEMHRASSALRSPCTSLAESIMRDTKAGGSHPMQLAAKDSNTMKHTHNYGKDYL